MAHQPGQRNHRHAPTAYVNVELAVPPHLLATYMVLLFHTWDGGHSFTVGRADVTSVASITDLAADVGRTPRTVKRHLAALEAAGLIRRKHRPWGDQFPTVYTIFVEPTS